MAQTVKFIDVTRTYLPVDPNAFPESLHTSGKEDAPESRIPVMAYKGYNFLPTSYGYKSYFGTAQTIGIDALVARVDNIFIFQNQGYENILIALTDSGVWTKKGEVAGAWVHSVAIVPPADPKVHYEWTSVIIANVLYAYQQGQPSYQKFVHSSTTQLTITSVVPTFLNMQAQVGIFRAAGRLAFWDSADSIGWANLDDFSDFTPSLETLAGNSVFTDIQGRIVNILPHGPGFIIYATKSVVYIAQNVDNLFQWKPTVILSTAGISYPRQVASASPDTLHFAYTSEGMKKIEMAKEETIVPEVTDFLKDYAFPVYLRVLGGRYLFLELLDPEYISGLIQLSDEVVPVVDYVFPGSTYTLDGVVPTGDGLSSCPIMAGIDKGFADSYPPPPNDQKPGSSMKPIWTCYLSNNGVKDPDNIIWTAGVCPTIDPNGVEVNMSPGGITPIMMTTDTSNKRAVTGAEAYIDGIWTMERFIQTQTAIWKMEADALKAYLAAIINRNKTVSKVSNAAVCVDTPYSNAKCTLGRYVSEFSAPQFGYSACSFWLTRAATAALDLIRVKANTILCEDVMAAGGASLLGWRIETFGPGYYATWQLALAQQTMYHLDPNNPPTENISSTLSAGAIQADDSQLLGGSSVSMNIVSNFGQNGFVTAGETWTTAPGFRLDTSRDTTKPGLIISKDGRWSKTERMVAYNEGKDVPDFGVGAIETAFCEITGWEYTKMDGTKGTTPTTGVCNSPSIYPPNSAPRSAGGGTAPISGADGSICGVPYIAPTLDGKTINWPTEIVTLPPSSFLLQLGSNAPLYPTFEGALVYDLQLKKWGKMRLRYKQLLDYSPINSTLNGVVPSNVFGIMAGSLGANGKISLFDQHPTDSYISYGKIGYYRGGNTSPEEVHVHFRTASTGILKVETSLDGRSLSAGFTMETPFSDATKVVGYGGYPGRWQNIEIRGIYDINYLEYRGFTKGRR